MRLVIGVGALAAALTAAATIAWVDVLTEDRTPVAAVTQVRYAPPKVEVADDVTDVDQAEAAAFVQQVVNDPRGWRTDLNHVTVRIVRPGEHGTTPMPGVIGTVYDKDLVAISAEAWTTLGPRLGALGGTLDDQRTWILLHEIGHLIEDSPDHTECAGSGPAPVMRANSNEIGDGCTFNVWPNP